MINLILPALLATLLAILYAIIFISTNHTDYLIISSIFVATTFVVVCISGLKGNK